MRLTSSPLIDKSFSLLKCEIVVGKKQPNLRAQSAGFKSLKNIFNSLSYMMEKNNESSYLRSSNEPKFCIFACKAKETINQLTKQFPINFISIIIDGTTISLLVKTQIFS